MSEDKYRCRQCLAEFNNPANDYPETSLKCPVCGNTDIEKPNISGGIREFLNRLTRSGYG